MKLDDLDLLKVGHTIQPVGAIYQGEGKLLLCLFPEAKGKLIEGTKGWGHPLYFGDVFDGGPENLDEVEILAMNMDDWMKFVRQLDLLETEVLAEAEDGALTKIILRKSQRQIAQSVSWEVFRRDDYRCRYCGRDDAPLTVDHLVLWEEGGPSTPRNLVAACKACNKKRGCTSYAEWLDHPYYHRASKNLTAAVRQANLDLVHTLADIPRMVHRSEKRR